MNANQTVEARMTELRSQINYHNHLYYVLDTPEITDTEWERLYEELVQLEAQHPELITEDSPTQVVGGEILSEFPEVVHEYPLGSLEKLKEPVIQSRLTKLKQELAGEEVDYIIEDKIDGLSVQLTYNNGKIELGATRGNGFVGENTTSNAKMVNDIPHKISFKGKLVTNGEIYMPKSVFLELNEERIKNGEEPFANPRNAAAGTMRQLDTSMVKKRKLSFIAYQVSEAEGVDFETHEDTLLFLQEQGFVISPDYVKSSDFTDIMEVLEASGENREELPYEIDGKVVKVNKLSIRTRLGSTAKYPKWAFAYKFETEKANTRIKSITLQVGRTGVITPVAELDTVVLAQTKVSRATLHNFSIISVKDIRVGDMVTIEKGGDIIPSVLSVVLEDRPEDSVPYFPPTHCPSCNSEVIQIAEEVAIRCVNKSCPEQLRFGLSHFGSRNAMDIDSLGVSVAEQLTSSGLVKSFADLYTLSAESLMTLDRMGKKSAEKLVTAIQKSKSRGLQHVLYGLGIKHIGNTVSKIIAQNFENLNQLYAIERDDLAAITGVGPAAANSLKDYLDNPENNELLVRFDSLGVSLESIKQVIVGDRFAGMTFVVTGELSKPRTEFKTVIESNGGKVSGSVSAKTSYILVGEDAGSKLEKAESLVAAGKMVASQILKEEDFWNLLG